MRRARGRLRIFSGMVVTQLCVLNHISTPNNSFFLCKIFKINNTTNPQKQTNKKHVKNPLPQIKNKERPSQGWLKNIVKRRTDQYGFYVDNWEIRGPKHLRTIRDNPVGRIPWLSEYRSREEDTKVYSKIWSPKIYIILHNNECGCESF